MSLTKTTRWREYDVLKGVLQDPRVDRSPEGSGMLDIENESMYSLNDLECFPVSAIASNFLEWTPDSLG